MVLDEFLYQQSEILVVTALFGLPLVATELGFRRGRVIRGSLEDPAKSEHVPEAVLLLLFLVAILAIGIVGFGCGIGDWRNLSVTVTMCLIITLVILVIMDLDRPRRGLIRVSQQSMVDLQDNIK